VGHAGTFNSNPVVMAAAAATLQELEQNGQAIYPRLAAMGQRLMASIRAAAVTAGRSVLVDGPGPVFQLYFTDQPAVRSYRDFVRCDMAAMRGFHTALLDRGVNIVGRGLWFLSAAHAEADIDQTIEAVGGAMGEIG